MPINKILILNFNDNECNGIYSRNCNVPLNNINNINFKDDCTIFYTKDETHHLFRYKGTWKISNYNINDYYLFSQCKKKKLWEHETFDFSIFKLNNASSSEQQAISNTDSLKKNNTIDSKLDLGWSQEYMGLKYHMEEALVEKQLQSHNATPCPTIALFSKKYYNEICELNHDKIYDFCFIGSIKSNYKKRKWVIDFAKKYFTCNSIFINTDNDTNWVLLGSFDYSNMNIGFCPKNMENNQSKKIQYRVVNENIEYFEKMCKSKYCLCPAGDAPWSFRFYEVLMCKSIPIVESWHHTYRTKEEANIKYKYILYQNIDNNINCDDYVNENTIIFENYHLLK